MMICRDGPVEELADGLSYNIGRHRAWSERYRNSTTLLLWWLFLDTIWMRPEIEAELRYLQRRSLQPWLPTSTTKTATAALVLPPCSS